MKNISRRVFIKGMAVAAVATATSAVLAGCNTNMIPGTDNGTEGGTTEDVTPGNVQTITWADQADEDKKLTIKVTDVVKHELENKVYIYAEVSNGLSNEVAINAATLTAAGYNLKGTTSNSVVVKNAAGADISSKTGTAAALDTTATAGVTNLYQATGSTVKVGSDKSVKGLFVLKDIDKEWDTITISFDVGKYTGSAEVTAYGSMKIELTNK